VKDAFFIVEPNQKQLVEIAKQLVPGLCVKPPNNVGISERFNPSYKSPNV
jgi:hypothetical protein